jgi:hypothetical protein
MQFAMRAYDEADARRLAEARKLLYVTDESGWQVPSPTYLAYQEFRRIVEQLEEGSHTAEELKEAYADWVAIGYKTEVDAALAVLDRLAHRSSQTDADRERYSLADEFLLSSGEQRFAPTYFAPLSASHETSWTRVVVPYSELRRLAPAIAGAANMFAQGASDGECEFTYTVLNVLRPWLSAQLYQADDWKLGSGDLVSDGAGVSGRIPAYPESVYVVRILRMSPPIGPGTDGGRPTQQGPIGLPRPPVVKWPQIVKRPPVVKRPLGQAVRFPDRENAGPLKADLGSGDKVQAGKMSPGVVSGTWTTTVSQDPLRAPIGTLGRPGQPVKALPAAWSWRLARVRLIDELRTQEPEEAHVPAADPAPATASEPLVVGFGCALLPPAPRPNEAYSW